MIEENVKIHDKFQFELKFTYQPEEHTGLTRYSVDTYFFLPKSLGISEKTYAKNDFYEDIQSYIRLKTPSVLLKNIYNGENSPLKKLEDSIDKVSTLSSAQNSTEYEYRIKMLCSIIKSAQRDEIAFIQKQAVDKDIERGVFHVSESLSEIMKEFRKLRNKINVSSIPPKLINLYSFADEYLSIITNEARHELYETADKSELKKKEGLAEAILKQAKDEISYRQEIGYPSIPSEDSDNETMIFRRSALKKLIGRVLFLNKKTKRAGTFAEQLLFGFAAALAMAFATFAAIMSKNRFEEVTLAFFITLVIAYVFKDRMKDLLKNYVSIAIRRIFADKKTRVYTNLDQKIGHIRETFSFIEESELPKNIGIARNRNYISGIDDGVHEENIMLYRKEICLISKSFGKIFPDFRISGINDIIRMNVSKFLSKMDNPEENVFLPKRTGYVKIQGSRVYHINIVIEYSTASSKHTVNCFRLVLNRNGIKRIEEVKEETISARLPN
jgi:hypothetical protein